MAAYSLLGISGALRAESTNTKLVHEAARIFDPAKFTFANLRFPLYDADLEDAEGIPAPVQTLYDQIAAADAVVISTPEYNKAPPGLLKNALDWVSVMKGNPWEDKPLAIMSSAGGRAGGERTQFALRLMMMPFRPRILQGPEVLVAQARGQYDENGRLTNEVNLKMLTELMAALRREIER